MRVNPIPLLDCRSLGWAGGAAGGAAGTGQEGSKGLLLPLINDGRRQGRSKRCWKGVFQEAPVVCGVKGNAGGGSFKLFTLLPEAPRYRNAPKVEGQGRAIAV